MSTDGNSSASVVSADAKLIVQAINRGWIGRGFQMGIGFWLAGLVVTFVGLVLFATFGAALLSSATHSDYDGNTFGSPSAYVAPPSPSSDKRDWREQLAAQEAVSESMRRNLASGTSAAHP